jgi:hypothetical protein
MAYMCVKMLFLISLLPIFLWCSHTLCKIHIFYKIIKKICFSSDGNNRSVADVQQYEGCVIYVQKTHNYSQRFEIFVCEKQKLKLNR